MILNPRQLATVTLFLAILTAASGCSQNIDTTYGQRRSGAADSSVNGTGVWAAMFQDAGHRVSTWRWLSPGLRTKADCIVWFPTQFEPPSAETREWLEDWLLDRPGRTLIYVGRDYDAAPDYWRRVRATIPASLRVEASRRLAESQNDFLRSRAALLGGEDCDWFAVDTGSTRPTIQTLEAADPRWLEDVSPSKLNLRLYSRMVPPPDAEVLLASQGDMLVSRSWWGESRLILVANGSFLLNYPLVNHQHRRLAGHLIAEIGPPKKNVVFLESTWGEPPILDEDPGLDPPSGLKFMSVVPLDRILLHFAGLGIIFCFSRFPIFGTPKVPEASHAADFGQHIEALGELLQRGGDRDDASRRVKLYHQRAPNEGHAV